MKIERKFTTAGQDAYASLDFVTTVSEIRNPDGTIVFHLDDVEVPNSWSQVASDVIATLYPRHHGISGISMEAAMYRTPILGGDYGANGLVIRENGLGETIDARDPSKLRKALIKVIEQDPVVDSKRRERLLSEQHPDRISESMNPWIDLENDV